MKKSVINVKKIFEKRGYRITNQCLEENYMEFVTKNNQPGKIIWSGIEKEGKEFLTKIFKDFIGKPLKFHIILVYNNMTNPALKIYNDYFSKFFDSELIHIDFLQKFIFESPLVPEVKIVEKDLIVKQYGGNEKSIPYMLVTDPVAVTMNYKVGQLIEETSYYDHSNKKIDMERPPIVTYRLVIDS